MNYTAVAKARLDQLIASCDAALAGARRSEPVVTREALESLKTVGLLADFITLVLAPTFAKYYEAHGWSIPLPCALSEAVTALADGKTRLPDAYLQAVFPSFWAAGNGPASRCREIAFWEDVLRYPCGLNDTGEVYDEITLATMRRSCRVQRKTVSFFSSARAFNVYEKYLTPSNGKARIWDPSGGFGARMLAAAAWARKHDTLTTYIACEPAALTQADLARLATSLSHPPDSLFLGSAVPSGSEHFLRSEPYDLVFTSPPYFATERYFDEPGQCWRDYPVLEQWKGAYLCPTIDIAKAMLRPGGKLVLNVKHDADAWEAAIGAGVETVNFPVKAGPFERARGETNLDERLLVWEKP